MPGPLDAFLDRLPTPAELAAMTPDQLASLRLAALDMTAIGPRDVAETKAWARKIAARVSAELQKRASA
jgi:hypothetical protein